MPNNIPLVSVCIPAYKELYLKVAISSALAQTYQNIEVLVSDDSPSDAVKQTCKEFGSNLTYLYNADRWGLGLGNMLNLLEHAKGEYIKFLFDDDILHPFCVQTLVGLAESPSKPSLAVSVRQIVDANGSPLEILNPLGISQDVIVEGREIIRILGSFMENVIGEPTTALFRRENLIHLGAPSLHPSLGIKPWLALIDVAMWLHLAQQGSVAIHAQPLSFIRRHESSNSNPDYNPNFAHCLTDWERVRQLALDLGYLNDDEKVSSLEKIKGYYLK